MSNIANLLEKLNPDFNNQLELSQNGQAIFAQKNNVVEVLTKLKEEYGFDRLGDLTSVDYNEYYEVVYHLLNDKAELFGIRVKLDKSDNVMPSVVSLWIAADPQEREVYDMMGIIFEGHGNLKRILNPEDFEGYPLQKSFKLDKVDRF